MGFPLYQFLLTNLQTICYVYGVQPQQRPELVACRIQDTRIHLSWISPKANGYHIHVNNVCVAKCRETEAIIKVRPDCNYHIRIGAVSITNHLVFSLLLIVKSLECIGTVNCLNDKYIEEELYIFNKENIPEVEKDNNGNKDFEILFDDNENIDNLSPKTSEESDETNNDKKVINHHKEVKLKFENQIANLRLLKSKNNNSLTSFLVQRTKYDRKVNRIRDKLLQTQTNQESQTNLQILLINSQIFQAKTQKTEFIKILESKKLSLTILEQQLQKFKMMDNLLIRKNSLELQAKNLMRLLGDESKIKMQLLQQLSLAKRNEQVLNIDLDFINEEVL
jgi:hypothetical protein